MAASERAVDGALSAAQARVVGESWLWRMEQEHLAVSVFSRLAIKLALLGCQPVVLEMVTRAAADEVRHASLCGAVARRWLGDDAVPEFFVGAPLKTDWRAATAQQAVVLDVIETCCVSETLTGVFFTHMLAMTTEPVARATVKSLLADELDHGRVGWAYLNERHQRGDDFAFVDEYLPAIVDRQVADILSPSCCEDDLTLQPYGYIGPHAAARIYRDGLRDVVIPGLQAVDIGAAFTLSA